MDFFPNDLTIYDILADLFIILVFPIILYLIGRNYSNSKEVNLLIKKIEQPYNEALEKLFPTEGVPKEISSVPFAIKLVQSMDLHLKKPKWWYRKKINLKDILDKNDAFIEAYNELADNFKDIKSTKDTSLLTVKDKPQHLIISETYLDLIFTLRSAK